MAIDGWNLLSNSTATSRHLRVLRQSVAGSGAWHGQVVLSKKYLQLFRPGFTHKAVFGGRGTSKTTSNAIYVVLRMDAAYTTFVGLRKRQVSIRHSVKRSIERAIRTLGLTHRFEITAFEIRNKFTGSIAFFRGLEHDSDETTRGLEGVDIFWLDEARNVSQEALSNLLRVIRERGAELLTSWNPLDPEDPIEKLYRGNNPPKSLLLIETGIEDNPAFFASPMAEEYWRLKAADEAAWRHVYGGAYDTRAGVRIYDNVEVGELPARYLDGERPAYGLDLGYVNDPTAIVRVWVLEAHKTIYVDREAVGYGADHDELTDLLDAVLDDKTDLVTSDNSEQRTTDALNRDGYNIAVTKKGGGSVVAGIRLVKGYRFIVHPECTNVIDETKRYRWKIDRQGNRTTVPIGPDHTLDAIRYAVTGRQDADDNPDNYVMVEIERGVLDWVHISKAGDSSGIRRL